MSSFEAFLNREKQILLNDQEWLEEGLAWYKDGDPLADGHQRMLKLQARNIEMLNTLLREGVEPELTRATCHEALKLAEQKHGRLIYQGKKNSEEWWETLETIQFLTALITRIENWKHRYQPGT